MVSLVGMYNMTQCWWERRMQDRKGFRVKRTSKRRHAK